jgi:hypothetical protein
VSLQRNPEPFFRHSIRFGREARDAYLALLPAENLKIHLDSIIVHALRVLCRAVLSILFLIDVHGDLVA